MVSDGGFSLSPSQLCNGGSVTELIKGLLIRDQRLQESVISYILYSALLVRWPRCIAANVREEVGCKHTESLLWIYFSAGEVWQAVMNVSPPQQLWEFFYVVCTSQPLHHILTCANDKWLIL